MPNVPTNAPQIGQTAHTPQQDETAQITAALIAYGVTDKPAHRLAKTQPADCRRHLLAFRPELHTINPGGYLRCAIEQGYAVDPPAKPSAIARQRHTQRRSAVTPTNTLPVSVEPSVIASAVSLARQALKTAAGKCREYAGG